MPLIHRLLQRLMAQAARLVYAQPGLILIIGLILAAGSIYLTATRWNVVNNNSDLLSNGSQQKQDFNNLVAEFGDDSRFVVLIKSDDIAKNRAAADDVGAFLQSLSPNVKTVLSKIDYSAVKQRLLFTRDKADLEKIADQIQKEVDLQQKTSKSSSQVSLDLNSILNEANGKIDDTYLRDAKNWGDFNSFVDRFVSILNKIAAQASGNAVPADSSAGGDEAAFDNIDADEMIAQHEYFSLQEGKAVLVFGYEGEHEVDSEAPFTNTVAKVRAHLAHMMADPKYAGVTLAVTGEPVLEADQIADSNVDTFHAGMITLALIIGLFFLSYRTFLRPFFTFMALIIGVLWSLGFTFITIGHFNVISVAVIPMVLGIGIDFGIQILGRYEEELGHHSDVRRAITASLQHTGVAIITGGSTTAIAFFTLCFNNFSGLAELGVIAGASMVFCIAANLLLLPAIFVLRDRNRSAESLRAQSSNSAWHFIHSWDRDMVRTPWLWIGLSVVISIASIISLPHLKFDYNLNNLQNPKAASVKALYEVMDASKGTNGDEVSTIYASVMTDNLDEAREMEKKLSALPVVARVDSPLQLLPPDQDEKLPIIRKIVSLAGQLNVKSSDGAPVDVVKARKDVTNLLKSTQEGLEQAKGAVNVSKIARQAVAAFSKLIPALEAADKALNSADVKTIQDRFSDKSSGAFNQMAKNIELLKTQKADRTLTLADLPPQLHKLFVSDNGKILLQVYGKKDLWERGPDEEFTKAVCSVAPHATGTPILNYYATEWLRIGYLWAAVWAFVAIVILILLHFQSFKYLLLTLTPLVLAVLWRTGAMVWLGIEFNPANIVTLPLIIGIDVAFGVYIIDRYREDGKLSIFSGSTGKAIFMSALTSLFGFGSLLVSQFRGMFSIGALMSLGIAIGLVTAIFILPQILVLLKPPAPEPDPNSDPFTRG